MLQRYIVYTLGKDRDHMEEICETLFNDDITRSVIQEQVEMGVAVRMAAMDLLARNRRNTGLQETEELSV